MTMNIYRLIKNQILEEIDDWRDKMVKKTQKQYDEEHFDEKTPYDKINCVVCNGKYARHAISKHKKTNRHQKGLTNLTNSIIEEFSE